MKETILGYEITARLSRRDPKSERTFPVPTSYTEKQVMAYAERLQDSGWHNVEVVISVISDVPFWDHPIGHQLRALWWGLFAPVLGTVGFLIGFAYVLALIAGV